MTFQFVSCASLSASQVRHIKIVIIQYYHYAVIILYGITIEIKS